MKMIAIFVEIFNTDLFQEVECSKFDNLCRLCKNFTEAASMGKSTWLAFGLIFINFVGPICTVEFLQELDFKHGSVAILHECQTVRWAHWQLFVYV